MSDSFYTDGTAIPKFAISKTSNFLSSNNIIRNQLHTLHECYANAKLIFIYWKELCNVNAMIINNTDNIETEL